MGQPEGMGFVGCACAREWGRAGLGPFCSRTAAAAWAYTSRMGLYTLLHADFDQTRPPPNMPPGRQGPRDHRLALRQAQPHHTCHDTVHQSPGSAHAARGLQSTPLSILDRGRTAPLCKPWSPHLGQGESGTHTWGSSWAM